MKTYTLFLLSAIFCIFASPAFAQQSVVDKGFARHILQANSGGEGNACQSVADSLSSRSRADLEKLREIIATGIQDKQSDLIGPLPIDSRFAGGLLNRIDDALGCLRYDMVLNGELTAYVSGGSGISYYNFTSETAGILEVYIGITTVMPYCGYLESLNEAIRVYIRTTVVRDLTFREVVKLELAR